MAALCVRVTYRSYWAMTVAWTGYRLLEWQEMAEAAYSFDRGRVLRTSLDNALECCRFSFGVQVGAGG